MRRTLTRTGLAVCVAALSAGAARAQVRDQPVTRGQMAVFLSTALGLHFPDAPGLH